MKGGTMTNKNEIKEMLLKYGFDLLEWSPGDGIARYKVVPKSWKANYFSISQEPMLGLVELRAYTHGLVTGINTKKK